MKKELSYLGWSIDLQEQKRTHAFIVVNVVAVLFHAFPVVDCSVFKNIGFHFNIRAELCEYYDSMILNRKKQSMHNYTKGTIHLSDAKGLHEGKGWKCDVNK